MNSISIVPTVTAEQLQNRLTTIQNEFKYSFFGRLVTPSREQITKINAFITEVDSASSEVLDKLDTTTLQNIEKHIQVLKARCWEYEKPTGFAFRILEFFGFAILNISLPERLTQVVNRALKERDSQISAAPQSLTTGEFTISQSRNGSRAIAMLGTATITGAATIADTVKMEVQQQLKQQGALFDNIQAVETSLQERKSLQDSPLPLGIFWLKGDTPMVTQYRSGTFYHRELEFGVDGHAISYLIGSGDNLKRIGAAGLDHLAPAGVRIPLKGSADDFRDMQFMRELQRRMKENGQWLGETSLQEVQEEAQKARRFISYVPGWFPKWFSSLFPQQKTVFGYGIDQVSGVPFYLKIDQEGSLRIQTDEKGDMITQDYAEDSLEKTVGFTPFQAKIAEYLEGVAASRKADETKAPTLDAALRQIESDPGFQVATAKHAKTCMQEVAGAFKGVEGLYAITSSLSKNAKETMTREYEITYIKDKKVHDLKLQVHYVGTEIYYSFIENATKETLVSSFKEVLNQFGCTQPYSDEVESQLTALYAQQAGFLNNFIGAYNDRLHTEAEVQIELSKMDRFLAGTQGRPYIIWKDMRSQYQVSFMSGAQVSFQVHFDVEKQQVLIDKVQMRSEEDLLSHFKQYNLVSQKEVKKLQIAQQECIREVTSYLTTTINKQKFLERIARVQQIDPSMAVGAYYICKQLDSESGPNTCLHYTLYVNTASGLQEIAIDLESCPGKILMGGQGLPPEKPAFATALKIEGACQNYEKLGDHLFAIKKAFAHVKNGVFKPQEVSDAVLTNSMAQIIEGLGSRCKEQLPVWAIQYTPPPSAPVVTRAITYVWNAVFGGEPSPLESAGTYSLVVFREKIGAKEQAITQQRYEILYDPLKEKFKIKGGGQGDAVASTSVEELVAKQLLLGSNSETHAIENVKAQIALEEARYRPLIDHQNFVGHSDVMEVEKRLVASQGSTPFILYRTKGAPVRLEGHGKLVCPTHGTYYAAWLGMSGEICSAPYKISLPKNSDKYAFWLDVTEAQKANMPPELVKFKPLS